MTRTLLSAPSHQAAGLTAETGAIIRPGGTAPPEAGDRGDRSPLVDLLPTLRKVSAYFSRIDVPSNITSLVASGETAIYGLRRLSIDADTGQEVLLAGAEMILAPSNSAAGTDWDGVVTANQVAWGDSGGRMAALIVGTNLPFQTIRTWGSAQIPLPHLETAAPNLLNDDAESGILIAQYFPSGAFTGSPTNGFMIYPRWSWGAYVARIPQGRTLDIALVCRGSQIRAGASKTLIGFAHVSLLVGLTADDQRWST